MTLEDKFWEHVAVCKHGHKCRRCCWEWTGRRDRASYGHLSYGGSSYPAYRLALMVQHHALALPLGGLTACHRCNHKPCCNPHHLFWATDGDNIRDAFRAGIIPPRGPSKRPL